MADNKQRLRMAVELMERGQYQSAEDILASIVPEDYHARQELALCQADICYRTGDYSRALDLMERYLLEAQDINRCQVHWLYALCLYSDGKPQHALQHLFACQDLVMKAKYKDEKDRADDLYNIFRELGHVALTLGQYEQSRHFYSQAGKYSRSPLQHCSWRAGLADTYLYSDQREGFEHHCQQVLELYFTSKKRERLDWLWPWLCNAMLHLGDYRLARDIYKSVDNQDNMNELEIPRLHWQYLAPPRFKTRLDELVYQALAVHNPDAGRMGQGAGRLWPWLVGAALATVMLLMWLVR